MANFTVFLDESGTHDSSPVTVMAAYVGTNVRWARFEREARPLLRSYDITAIHATSLWGTSREFHKWSDGKKQALIRDLAHLMRRWVRFGVTVTLENEPFKHVIKTRPVGTVDSEFATCFRACMLYIPQLIRKFGLDNDPRADFVIEDGHRNLQEAVELFHVTQQSDATLNRQLASINKAEKAKFVGTQLADLLAFLSYKQACKFVTRRIILPSPAMFEELLKGAPVHHYYFNETELVAIKLSVVSDWSKVRLPSRTRGAT